MRPDGTATPLAVPLPPCDAERPTEGEASAGDVDFEAPTSRVELGALSATELVAEEPFVADDGSETVAAAPVPEPLEDALAVVDVSRDLASDVPSAVLLLPFDAVRCPDFSGLVLAWRAARRFPSAAAA